MVDSTPTMWDKEEAWSEGWLFIEFPEFSRFRDDYFRTDSSFADFQTNLVIQPDQGDVVPGCGGLRKVRWADPRRGKGKRGGLRVIYLLLPEIRVIVLLDVYDKEEAIDLTPHQKREISRLAKAIKVELSRMHDTRNKE